MAAARSGSTVYWTPLACRPGSISARIAAGSSERGLSLVATTKSLPSPAAWPILGRLVRSRSPPQPKSVMTRAPGARGHLAGERGQIAQRVVGVGVVHDHGEGLAGIDGLKAAGNGLERGNGGDEMRKRNAARMRSGEGGEQIEDVHFAGQTRVTHGRAGRSFELDHRAGRRERVARGAPVALANSIGANLRAGLARGRGQFFACGSCALMTATRGAG